jgi:hypothetical protein
MFGALMATVAERGTTLRSRLLRGHEIRPTLGWLLYGVLWTPLAPLITSSLSQRPIIDSDRFNSLQQLFAANHHGFGPLVQMIGPHSFRPAGLTDDQGGFLVTPWISDLLHTQNPVTVTHAMFVVSWLLVLAAYPLLIRRLTGSAAAALAAPLLVLAFLYFHTDYPFYWVPTVTVALCVPWLLVLVKRRSAPLASLAAIAAIAGITQTFRAGTSVGVLVAAAFLPIIGLITWRRRLASLAVIALAYLVFATALPDLALQLRADRMHGYPVNTYGESGVTSWSDGSGHPFWHNVYIGLGVVHNRYGIYWDDSVSAAYVQSVDPHAAYQGPRYEAILRDRVLHLLTHDPGFVLRAERRKVGDLLADGLDQFPSLLLLLPVAFALGIGRGRRRSYTAVLLPIALFAVAPALVTIPHTTYEFPWFGLLGTLGVLCSCWLIAAVAQRLARLASEPRWQPMREPVAKLAEGLPESRTAVHRLARSRTAYLTVAVIAVGILVRSYLVDWRAKQSEQAAPLSGTPTLRFKAALPRTVTQWQARSLSSTWKVELAKVARGPGAGTVSVSTAGASGNYQLLSPVVPLPAGRYVAAIRGEVQSGGLLLGVLDVRANKWIAQDPFAATSPPSRATMPVSFTLSSPKAVRVILSNWGSGSRPASSWLLNAALIARHGRSS